MRLGFAGLGHLGQDLLAAALPLAPQLQPVAIQDPAPAGLEAAEALRPGLSRFSDYDAMLAGTALDAVVISTPTFLHVPQATAALQRGLHVLLQKPPALSGDEAATLLAEAGAGRGVLFVDYSYRYTASARAVKAAVGAGTLGRLLAVEARFHNIWGPQQGWFYRRSTAGGGALLDLGVHMLDLALYLLDFPEARVTSAHLTREGTPLREHDADAVEDFAVLGGEMGGAPLTCAVSWNAQLPQSEISLTLYGSSATLLWGNRDGSFYDFEALMARNGRQELLAEETTDLRSDTLRAFQAAVAAAQRDYSGYAAVPRLLDEAFALAGG
ncbi:MAG TPA: Gfo/Idh/MocA family oxidoreductase [Chloroflexia bacterium]|nr:Gfo/Idh/MocA family oxidoreductase [Chloroflexia bacterium]